MTIMVDGISLDVPAIHARYPSNPVACYVNGAYAWTSAQEALFARKIRMSIRARQPQAARVARGIDIEPVPEIGGDAGPEDVPAFLAARVASGHADGTVYAALETVPVVLQHVSVATVPRWWLAWYWQRPGHPTAAQVLAELHRLTGVDLPPERLWACQYASYAQWDLSVVYGPEDFSR